MRREVNARFANGVVSAALTIFFLAHGILGAAALVFGFFGSFAWVVWVGVPLIAVHVVFSIVTSRNQLNDKTRPPSARKKRHLALKWATGMLLAACATAHVICKDAVSGRIAIIALTVTLTVHLCVGAKSLLKDLDIDRKFKMAFRLVVCVFAAVFAVAVILSAFLR